MTAPQLDLHINQFFAFAALTRAERYGDVTPSFTYRTSDLLLSVFAEAIDTIERTAEQEYVPELLRYAQVFERFSAVNVDGVDRKHAARTAAAFYWLAGYGANALVLARNLGASQPGPKERRRGPRLDKLSDVLVATLGRSIFSRVASESVVASHLRWYLNTGTKAAIASALSHIDRASRRAFELGDSGEYAAGVLLDACLRRLERVSLWGSLGGRASAPVAAWRRYAKLQSDSQSPLIELWPSQRRAIEKGLLDGRSSLVLRMPTSSGKTKLTELAFVNDLASHGGRCLYLAPFRALVADVESSLAKALSGLSYTVASLYGSSDANELEVELANTARIVIATPEKIGAVARLSGGQLADFATIVVDEGHLLGTRSRGAAFELQLAALRSAIAQRQNAGAPAPRVVFLSAVLPNAGEIARWLTGSEASLAETDWHPTAMHIGILTWGRNRYARVDYLPDAEGDAESAYFVPRLLETDEWRKRNPTTRRLRTYAFPDRKKKSSVAAAYAFQAAKHGSVLVFAQQPRWVNSIAQCVIERRLHDRPIETWLIGDDNASALAELASFVASRIGADSVVARALAIGVGLHHSRVPQGIRLLLEDAFRDQTIRLLVATSTVAQGVNFPARTVVVHSLPGGESPIRDFWNLAGRAGRAMRETEGELIVLSPDSSHPTSAERFLAQGEQASLRRFFDPGKTEQARSQILQLVEALIEHGGISDETVAALLAAPIDHDSVDWSKQVAAIDTDLLERLVEDVEGADDAAIESLLPHLLATTQANVSANPDSLTDGLRSLFQQRAKSVRAAVPVAETRLRYARTGLTAPNAISLDAQRDALRDRLRQAPQLNDDILAAVIRAACAAPELAGESPEELTRTSAAWLKSGRYDQVQLAAPGRLASIDEAIEYVEDVLGYKLTWLLNGLLRLMDEGQTSPPSAANVEDLPEWFRYLPQYVRYGIADRELLWLMTLGIHDRRYAEMILAALVGAADARPTGFRQLVATLVDAEETVLRLARESQWSPYFVRQLGQIITRYRTLLAGAEPMT